MRADFKAFMTAEEIELQEKAHDFAWNVLNPVVAACDREQRFPMEVFEKWKEENYHTMFLPKELGGGGRPQIEKEIIYEEIAQADAGFVATAAGAEFGIEAILLAGTEEQKKHYAQFAVERGQIGAFCLTETEAGCDAGATQCSYKKVGDEYIINGHKDYITGASIAGVYTVFATGDPSLGTKGISCFIIERDREGVSIGKVYDKLGMRLSDVAQVNFDNVRIPAKNLVGAEGKGFSIAMRCLDVSRGNNSYGALAISQRALDECVKYANSRVTYGKPIIKHQSIQNIIADMEIRICAGRAMLWQCARLVDAGACSSAFSASTKTFISDSAMQITTDAIQVFGGYGYCRDYPVEKLMRDAKIWQIFEGTNQIQRMVIANTLSRAYKG